MKERWSHEAKGLVLRSRVTGLVYVCYDMTAQGDWNACPIHDPHGVYNPGGYNVLVSAADVESAELCKISWEGLSDPGYSETTGACLCECSTHDFGESPRCDACWHPSHGARKFCGALQ